jgi:asparagine synthase (glutamine-hydrolysing)
MCGIFGTIHYPIEDKAAVLKALAHRGPGEQNVLEVGPVTWFHTRLAIQDLSPSGRQPMQRGSLYITFNGEIYNHQELRDKYGFRDPSHSDTLTLLLLYERLGMAMLDELDGMFALGIYDSARGKVFLARDRAGKKPLYLWQTGGRFAFSSELGALAQALPLELDEGALSGYLYLGYHFGRATPYKDVREVEAGTWMEIDLGTGLTRSERWFDITKYYQAQAPIREDEALAGVEERLRRAVRRRIDSSDLEVGSFLSGGIDSGLVTALSAEYSHSLRTFTVKLPGAYDESELAAQVARRYDTRHTTISISFDGLRDDFARIIAGYGEPFFDSSAIPSYYVSKEAKQHITVVLNGDGADELFGGYRRYVPFRHVDFFSLPAWQRKVARGVSSLLPTAHEKQSGYTYVYRLLRFASFEGLPDIYASATTDLFTGFREELIKKPELAGLGDWLSRVNKLPISSLSKILAADFGAVLPGDLLPKMDIATMAHALEGRSPFLGKDLLEWAPTLPDDYKVKGKTTKYLLRTLAGKYLPPDLPGQPKRGFEIPLKQWMDTELRDLCQEYLQAPGALYPAYVRPAFVQDLLERKVAVSDEKRAKMLYALLCLEVWYRRVYQKSAG